MSYSLKAWQTGSVHVGGITGRAVSLALARQGAMVAVVYSRSAEQATQTVKDILSDGGRALAIQADISDPKQVDAALLQITSAFERLDFLVNNAGITRQLPFANLDDISDDAWDDLYAVNVKGAFYCSRAAAPILRQSPRASIVNVGSIAGETGYGSSIPYAVSKAAMHGLTRSLARACTANSGQCPGAWRHRYTLVERQS